MPAVKEAALLTDDQAAAFVNGAVIVAVILALVGAESVK